MARGPSERRRRKRKNEERRIATEALLKKLRAHGASCGSCKSFSKIPSHVFGPGKHYCDKDTDFYGYAMIVADDICTLYEQKIKP